jgi:hypothetical protein
MNVNVAGDYGCLATQLLLADDFVNLPRVSETLSRYCREAISQA